MDFDKAIKRRFTMPPQIACASALPVKTGQHDNHIFHSIGLCYIHNAPVHCLQTSRMLCSLPRSCLVHPVDRFDSEGWFSSDQVIFFNCVSCFLVKKQAAFKWKDAISGFPVSPGSAETQSNCTCKNYSKL